MNSSSKKIDFMGVRVHALTMAETIDACDKLIKTGKPHQHVVINAAKIVNMQKSKELFDDVAGADIINADGMSIVWGAKLLGKRLPERVAGIDVFYNLLALSEKKGYRVYFFGATDDVLKKMVKIIKKKHPRIKIAGFRNGYVKEAEQDAIARAIKKSRAQLLFVGISSPMKERFIKKYLKATGVSLAMGVGGSFDVLSGKTKRAPIWMQKSGLEWFYRFMQEPTRMFARYAKTNSAFVILLVKELFKRKK